MKSFIEKNRWIVLLAGVLVMVCTTFPQVWSVFLNDVSKEYGLNPTQAATVYPMCGAFFGVFSIIGGRLQDKMSPRTVAMVGTVIFTIGILMLTVFGKVNSVATLYFGFSMPFGFGCGLVSPVMSASAMKWYADKKGFAVGFRGAASAVVMMGFTYAAKYLLSTFGLRKTFLILAIVFFIISFVSSIFFVNPDDSYILEKSAIADKNMKKDKSNTDIKNYVPVEFTPKEMIKTKQFWILYFAGIFAAPLFLLIPPIIVRFGISRGLSENLAVSAVAISTGVSAFGKFIIPTISDKIGRKKCAIFFTSLTLISAVILMYSHGIGIIIMYTLMVLFYNGWIMLTSPLLVDMFGTKNAGANMGILMTYSTITAVGSSVLVNILTPVLGELTPNIIGVVGIAIALIFMFFLDTDTSKLKNNR